MATKNELVDNPVRQEVNITRIFDAPRELVFKMWTDPALVEKWWGPKDFINPVCKLDARVDGSMRIVMQGPDGMKYPTRGIFTEITEHERIVFTNIKEGDNGEAQLEVLNTVTFMEENGKTKMTLRATVVKSTPEACGSVDGMNVGWNQSIDRFADLLASVNK
ncbi:MAG: hypothetical protein JWQ63_3945 [Mucilaginibacter sp.]|nr:hypothetical protein [Mucilaginibacter sp.]